MQILVQPYIKISRYNIKFYSIRYNCIYMCNTVCNFKNLYRCLDLSRLAYLSDTFEALEGLLRLPCLSNE